MVKPLGVTMASKSNCNQIKIFINLKIIGEENFYLSIYLFIYLKSKNLNIHTHTHIYIYIYIYLKKSKKKILQFLTCSKKFMEV